MRITTYKPILLCIGSSHPYHPKRDENLRESDRSRGESKTRSAHRPVRWLSILMGLAIVMVSGTVLADVVLTYSVANNLNTGATSPFTFAEGSNYVTANGLGMLPAPSCNPGALGSDCYQLDTTVVGVQYVPTEILNGYSFEETEATTAAWTVGSTSIAGVAPSTAPTNVVCAYAFISDETLAPGDVTVSTTSTSCTTPSLSLTGATLNAACGTGSTGGISAIDLTTGTVVATTGPWTCSIASGSGAASTMLLTISYFIYSNTGRSTTAAAGASIQISPGSS